MSRNAKTRERLVAELTEMRRRVTDLEATQAERDQVMAELRESEQKLQRFIECSPDGIIRATEQGRIEEWNSAQERISGLKAAEVLGKPLAEVLYRMAPPEERTPEVRRNLEVFLQRFYRGEPVPRRHRLQERVVQRPDGERRIIQYVLFRTKTPTGVLVGTIGRDITEERRAEQALRAREENYRAIFDAANDAIFVHDIETGAIIDINAKATEMYGYTRDKARGLSLDAFSAGTPPYAQWEALDWLHRAATDGAVRFDWLARDKGRRLFWVEVNVKPVVIGGVERLLAIVRDITERKQAEQERERLLEQIRHLAEQAQARAAELKTIIDSIPDVVFVVDAESRLTLINEAATILLGVKAGQALGMSLESFREQLRIRHLDGTPVVADDLPLARALRGETVVMQDDVFYHQTEKRDVYLRSNMAPIRDAKGRIVGAVAVSRDVSELIEVERLKDDFIRVAAHELKTPVAIVKGYAEVLLRSKQAPPDQRQNMLEAIERGADRMDRIIQDLLDISQLELRRLEMKQDRVDLSELVREVVEGIAPTAHKHSLRLRKVAPAVVVGDRQRLEQVVRQLIENAIKYSPNGGDVDVEIDVRDQEVAVSVTDHGIAIPKARQRRIFQRFYRAHAGTPHDFGGMGVGLYLSREIVRQHRGRMWFESEIGQGSTFHFSLPLAAQPE